MIIFSSHAQMRLIAQEICIEMKQSAAHPYSNSKSFVSLLPSARRATALSSPRRLDTNDLEMELQTIGAFHLDRLHRKQKGFQHLLPTRLFAVHAYAHRKHARRSKFKPPQASQQ